MDLLEDPIFKTKYQKNKIKLKLWESDFIEKYKRKPTKVSVSALILKNNYLVVLFFYLTL